MNILLSDIHARKKLAPISLTRSVADIRIGILTIKERWELMTGLKVFMLTDDYLQNLYDPIPEGEYIEIDATFVDFNFIYSRLLKINLKEDLTTILISIFGTLFYNKENRPLLLNRKQKNIENIGQKTNLQSCYQVIQMNEELLRFDYSLLTLNNQSKLINNTVTVISKDQIFVEEGANVSHCTLNASTGPIYIGKKATIMEGSFIRGPFALCEGALVKMGAKIYGATTIGPNCTVGSEIKNSILMANSNKAHDGYLGDSLIGEWCNIGAGTSNSNVKNTGGEVKMWNDESKAYLPAGNKCGVVMGDYTRTSINSSINTGSYYGVCCNVFGEGLLPKKINNFSWGIHGEIYNLNKSFQDISNWMVFKQQVLKVETMKMLQYLSESNAD